MKSLANYLAMVEVREIRAAAPGGRWMQCYHLPVSVFTENYGFSNHPIEGRAARLLPYGINGEDSPELGGDDQLDILVRPEYVRDTKWL